MKTFTHPRRIVWLKIVLGLLFFFPVIISSQNRVFPEKDAIWCIKTDFQPRMLLYGLTGDTVINEKQYGKLYQLSDTTLNIDENDQYVGAIRTEERKVWMKPEYYYYQDSDGEEFLLYDFTKSVGEYLSDIHFVTFPVIDLPSFDILNKGSFLMKVLAIEEDISGRKHYRIGGDVVDMDEWIEGIGSLEGLFYYATVEPIGNSKKYNSRSFGKRTVLVSLKQGDSIVYHNKDVCKEPYCWFGVGVEDTRQKQTVTLYPNPVKETLHIDLGEIPLPVRFELFDPQGRITYTQALTPKP